MVTLYVFKALIIATRTRALRGGLFRRLHPYPFAHGLPTLVNIYFGPGLRRALEPKCGESSANLTNPPQSLSLMDYKFG